MVTMVEPAAGQPELRPGQVFIMRLALKILAVLLVGIALGLLATWLSVFHGSPERVRDGPWKTNLAAGSAESNPYRRAFVAIHGLFALNRSETVYYTTEADSDGQALDGHCRYEIRGRSPDARWWSVTAYGPDDFLIPNPAHRYSVSKSSIRQDANGNFAVQVGGAAGGDGWIPVGAGGFSLMLRLYIPGPSVAADPTDAAMPAVTRVSCP
jgi:hypothetical protein